MNTPNSQVTEQARITELTELLAQATPGPWLYRAKSNSFHLPPEPGTTYSYGYSIMDDENCLRDAAAQSELEEPSP